MQRGDVAPLNSTILCLIVIIFFLVDSYMNLCVIIHLGLAAETKSEYIFAFISLNVHHMETCVRRNFQTSS